MIETPAPPPPPVPPEKQEPLVIPYGESTPSVSGSPIFEDGMIEYLHGIAMGTNPDFKKHNIQVVRHNDFLTDALILLDRPITAVDTRRAFSMTFTAAMITTEKTSELKTVKGRVTTLFGPVVTHVTGMLITSHEDAKSMWEDLTTGTYEGDDEGDADEEDTDPEDDFDNE